MVYYVVQNLRAVRGDNAWIQWQGYPEKRACWRSVRDHLRTSVGDGVVPPAQAPLLKGKAVSVYGYSKTFGRSAGCNEHSAALIGEALPECKVTWSDKGY